MSIYETSVKKPITTALIYVAIAILGLFALTRLAIELMPNTDTTTVMIITAYPGASAEDIESNVTKVLENSLNGIDKLKHISSKSQENSSIITMQFRAGTPIAEATNDIRDKLDATSELLPTGAKKPTIFKFDNASIPVAMLSVQSKESAPALAKILEDKVTNPLQRIDGVGSVSVLGATKRVIQVYCDPSKLEAYHLTTQQIAQIIGAENTNIPAGQIDLGSRTNSLRVQGEFTDPAQLSSIIVTSVGGKDVRLSDVATVKDTVAERQQENYINGMTGAMVMISKQAGSNSVKISEQVRRMLPQIQQSLYITFVIVMLVVFIFLGRWRATFIIVLTIPISLVASFIYLLVSGNSLNVISLSSLSIAIGMVVDDAIVVLENVTTHIERGSAPRQAAIHGTNEVGISVIASTLTMLAVFLPLTMTPGDAGVMFRQLGWSISIVMIVSTAAALSLTPMLSSQLLRKGVSRGKVLTRFFAPIEAVLGKLDLLYARLLGWTVRHRRSTILSALGIFVLSLLGLQFIKSSFMPKQDVGFIDASVELPVGTRVEETRQFALDLEARMRQTFPAIQTISMSVGQADASNAYASTQENGSNVASMFIGLRPQKERSMTQDEVAAGLRSLFAKTPEVTSFKVSSGDGNPNSSSGLVIELYGQDFQRSDSYARLLSEQLKDKASVSGISISRKDYTPELRFVFDRTKLAEQGLNLATASSYLRSAVNGTVSSYFREEGSEYDIRVSLAPEARQSVQDLMNILVYTPQGKAVRLSELGRLDESFTPPTIERKDRSRYVALTVNAAPGSQLSEVVADAQQILDAHPLPEGMSYKLTGAYESQQETFGDLGVLMALIVLLVFIVMAAQFESLVDPFVIMFSVPFAVTGVFIGLLVTQVPMDTMTFIGMIMLIGIVVKNGIVLIDYIRLCRERGMIISRAVVTSGKSRLRPVLMTTMTTVLGMLPMALGIGEGSEMWQAMGITVAWGLSISTLVTLVLIPTLYAALEARRLKRRRI